jgi:ABC-type antimicrobial peptide transport system permease subunit
MRVVSGFGVVALLVAAVGIYGTLSYVVAARTREIGIRLALGAPRRRISRSMLVRGVLPAIGGSVLGISAAVLLARLFRSILFQTPALDGGSLTGAVLLLTIVAVIAAAGPALRAARVDPIVALRAD